MFRLKTCKYKIYLENLRDNKYVEKFKICIKFFSGEFFLGFGPARVLAGQTGLNRMALRTLKKA
jgi:hypothetical protein